MVLPRVFSNERERIIASFDFIEFATGTGFINYFAFSNSPAAGSDPDHYLTTQLPRSLEIETEIATDIGFKNFDLSPFATPIKAGGQAIVTMSYKFNQAGAPDPSHITIDIIKVDGVSSAETVIGSISGPTSVTNVELNETLVIDVTETVFAIGDFLRLKVKAIKESGAATPNYQVGIDPQNRDGPNLTPSTEDVTTQLKLAMPYRIQL